MTLADQVLGLFPDRIGEETSEEIRPRVGVYESREGNNDEVAHTPHELQEGAVLSAGYGQQGMYRVFLSTDSMFDNERTRRHHVDARQEPPPSLWIPSFSPIHAHARRLHMPATRFLLR